MHCLVTGGAGLIGSHIVDELLTRGHEVTILDNLHPQTHPEGKPKWVPNEARFIHGDVNNYEDVEIALKQGVDSISHQAAFGGFTSSMSYYFDSNVSGTAKIFEVIRENKVNINKFVLASSQAIFGEGLYKSPNGNIFHAEPRSIKQLKNKDWEIKCPETGKESEPFPFDENLDPFGESPYALSKYFEELIALRIGRSLGIPVAAFRYAVTYGPRQSIHNPYTGVFSIFSSQITNNISPLIFEDGNQTRDFIYVQDVAEANVLMLEKEFNSQDVFNVGTGVGTTVNNLNTYLTEGLNKNIEPILSGEFRPGDSRHFIHNSERLRNKGWKPKIDIKSGVINYLEWFTTLENVSTTFQEASDKLRQIGVIQDS